MGNDDVRARRARADRALFLVLLHALLQLMFFTHVRESRPGRAQCPGAARREPPAHASARRASGQATSAGTFRGVAMRNTRASPCQDYTCVRT